MSHEQGMAGGFKIKLTILNVYFNYWVKKTWRFCMKTPREDAARTRKNLLDAACDIFAAKGFRDSTISEISARAKANIAAVNYHFGSKETLYIEAWRSAFQASIKAHPPDGGASPDASPEERLHAHLAATVRRLADKNNREYWFVQREFIQPTGLLEEVMQREIHPLQKQIQGLVRELLGPSASDLDVQFCETSIISQCITPIVAGKKPGGKAIAKAGPPVITDVAAYIDHVVEFSLAGLRAVRQRVEAKKGCHPHKRKNKRGKENP
jgi:AcrR family transcriptional regulator